MTDIPEPASSPANDPISQVYRALRHFILLSPDFPIKEGNFPDMTDKKYIDGFTSDAPVDYPNTMLLQSTYRFLPHGRNSMVSSLNQTFPLVTTIDDMSLGELNAIKWPIFDALRNADQSLNLPFVSAWDVREGSDSYTANTEFRRNQRRWSSMLNFVVVCNFDRNEKF